MRAASLVSDGPDGADAPRPTIAHARPKGARNVWLDVLRSYAIGFALTAGPIFLHLASQPVALAFCVLGAIAASRLFEQDVPAIVLTANVFQNVFISQTSPFYSDFSEIEVLKSYNFVTTIVCYLTVAYGFLRQPTIFSPFIQRVILYSVAVLAVVGVYFVLGMAVNPRNAIIYLRNISLPIFFLQIFLIVGAKHRVSLPQSAVALLFFVGICCYIELLSNELWLTLTNGMAYLNLATAKRLLNVDEIRVMKEAGMVVTSPVDYSRSTFLNTALTSDLNLQVQRLAGPNFSSISLGYMLSILIAFLSLHGYILAALLATPLLLATSAKGPMVLAILCIGFYAFAKRSRSNLPLQGLFVLLVIYAIFVFQSGLRHGDYHVLGLLGGVNGLLKLPVGHTLGDGGNLSIPDFSKLNWGDFQRSGAANIAVESSVGVLIYQMGLAAAVLFAFYGWIAWTGWRLFKATRAPAMAFTTGAIFICLVNGLYQEEAYFVPLSLPFIMGFAGLSLGAMDRLIAPRAAARLRTESAPG